MSSAVGRLFAGALLLSLVTMAPAQRVSGQNSPDQDAPAQAPVPLPPIDPPVPMTAAAGQSAGQAAATLRINSTVVLVPTLVEQPSTGKVIYGLTGDNFTLEDNGVPQKIHVDDDLDTTPVSLVVCIERGRSSELEFGKYSRLAPLLDQFLGSGNGELALVEFDSKTMFREGFTKDTSVIDEDLQELQPGDGGAAILDAVGTSIDILEQRPPERRRILLLIAESRDHGSKQVNERQLVERIGTSNTLVLSLTWSPVKAEYLDQLAHGGGGGLIGLIQLAINAMHSNVSKSLAVMSGGEYTSFGRDKSFEEKVSEMASHARNRYILSFRPSNPEPGLHSISVKLNANVDGKAIARTNYWAVAP